MIQALQAQAHHHVATLHLIQKLIDYLAPPSPEHHQTGHARLTQLISGSDGKNMDGLRSSTGSSTHSQGLISTLLSVVAYSPVYVCVEAAIGLLHDLASRVADYVACAMVQEEPQHGRVSGIQLLVAGLERLARRSLSHQPTCISDAATSNLPQASYPSTHRLLHQLLTVLNLVLMCHPSDEPPDEETADLAVQVRASVIADLPTDAMANVLQLLFHAHIGQRVARGDAGPQAKAVFSGMPWVLRPKLHSLVAARQQQLFVDTWVGPQHPMVTTSYGLTVSLSSSMLRTLAELVLTLATSARLEPIVVRTGAVGALVASLALQPMSDVLSCAVTQALVGILKASSIDMCYVVLCEQHLLAQLQCLPEAVGERRLRPGYIGWLAQFIKAYQSQAPNLSLMAPTTPFQPRFGRDFGLHAYTPTDNSPDGPLGWNATPGPTAASPHASPATVLVLPAPPLTSLGMGILSSVSSIKTSPLPGSPAGQLLSPVTPGQHVCMATAHSPSQIAMAGKPQKHLVASVAAHYTPTPTEAPSYNTSAWPRDMCPREQIFYKATLDYPAAWHHLLSITEGIRAHDKKHLMWSPDLAYELHNSAMKARPQQDKSPGSHQNKPKHPGITSPAHEFVPTFNNLPVGMHTPSGATEDELFEVGDDDMLWPDYNHASSNTDDVTSSVHHGASMEEDVPSTWVVCQDMGPA